jgi:tetratricopeptide (TPR) repeat protein
VNRTFSRMAAAAALLFVAHNAIAASAVEEAQTLVNQGQLDAALKRLDSQLKTAPQDAEARFMRGLVLTRLNRSEEAIKAFADITRDYPQLPEPYNNLAVLYAQQGDYEKARDALEAALATHPSYATAHENLGDIYAALAGAAYNRALMLDQSNQAVRNKLSFVNKLSDNANAPRPAAPATAVAAAPAPAAPAAAAIAPAAPVAPAAPAAPAAATASDEVDSGTTTAVRDALGVWAKTWSNQDVDGYLATYADDFRPEGGISRATWEAQRRDRVKRPKRIRVGVVNPRVSALGDGRVRVTFRQEYESDSFSDTVTKVLELRDDGGWKIVREYTR